MANEFVAKRGLIVSGNTLITGSVTSSLGYTGSLTGLLVGTASWATSALNATSASYAASSSFMQNYKLSGSGQILVGLNTPLKIIGELYDQPSIQISSSILAILSGSINIKDQPAELGYYIITSANSPLTTQSTVLISRPGIEYSTYYFAGGSPIGHRLLDHRVKFLTSSSMEYQFTSEINSASVTRNWNISLFYDSAQPNYASFAPSFDDPITQGRQTWNLGSPNGYTPRLYPFTNLYLSGTGSAVIFYASSSAGLFSGSRAIIPSITGSMFGTASYATIAQNVLGSITSASYAETSSYANTDWIAINNKPAGLVSSSVQINTGSFTGSFTGAFQGSASYAGTDWLAVNNKPVGLLSSSIQINTGSFTGSFTGAFQGLGSGITGVVSASYAGTDWLAVNNRPVGLVSSSAQINTGSFSGSFTGAFQGLGSGITGVISASYSNIAGNVPSSYPSRHYFGKFLSPASSSYVTWQPSLVLDANDLAPQSRVLAYSSSINGRNQAFTTVAIPPNYGIGAKVGIRWKTSATTGNAIWIVEYRSVADGESFDPTTWQGSGSVTGSANGTTRFLTTSEVTLTDGDFAPNDMILLSVARERNGAADTLTANAELIDAYFSYTGSTP